MIRIRDALTLSVTKLKTRKVRLIVTTIVSGLFFIVLTVASLVFTGVTNSIESYAKDGFGNRYLAQVGTYSNVEFEYMYDNTLIESAKEIDKKLIEDKKAEAKKLGIEYDATSEILSVMKDPNQLEDSREMINPTPQTASIIDAYKAEKYKQHFDKLDERLAQYEVEGKYFGVTLAGNSAVNAEGMTLNVIKNNAELTSSGSDMYGQKGFASLASGLTAIDAKVIEPFLLEGQTAILQDDNSIPVVAPFSVVEEALGYTSLPSTAKSKDKLARIQEVRSKAAGSTFQACIRNQTSVDRQQLAVQQAQDERLGKDNKDYKKPDLMFAVSDQVCSDVIISRDVRTSATKRLAEKQAQFDEKFGKQPATQRLITFRIIGVTPDLPGYDSGFSVKAIISSILTSSAGIGWFVPIEAQTLLPEYQQTFSRAGVHANYPDQVLVEFSSASEAKRFQKTEGCNPGFAIADLQAYCDGQGTPFSVNSYGSNSVAIEDARNGFDSFFSKASIVVALISAVIMMGTIGKVIADSRRETAVFRAIGAKRLDIASVYLLYAFQLGLIIVAFALGVGYILAKWFDIHNSASITVDALTIFNSQDLKREFHLIGFDVMQISKIIGVVLAAALLSSLLPLINNLKRNPIKDMRDER